MRRQLIAEKEVFRELERHATETHFARLREGRMESVETSALHLDILRDTKRINFAIAPPATPCSPPTRPSAKRRRKGRRLLRWHVIRCTRRRLALHPAAPGAEVRDSSARGNLHDWPA